MKIVIGGPPQCGKTTVASVAKERYGLCYVSTSEVVRNAVHSGNSAYSATLKPLVESGEVIPDVLLVQLVAEATRRPDCVKGFVLDGFPRTWTQSKLLQESEKVSLDAVVELDVGDKAMLERFGGRWYHPRSGRFYHTLYNPPKEDGKDDVTREPLAQRPEDTPEYIIQSLLQYRRQADEVRETLAPEQWIAVEASGNVESVRCNVFMVLDMLQQSLSEKAAKARWWWKRC